MKREYDGNDAMENLLNRLITDYREFNNQDFNITATIIDPFGKYLGCRVIWSPRDKHLFPVTLLTEYGIIKVRSKKGERLVKTVNKPMCAYFDNLAQE